MARWGRHGERLTPAECERRDRARAAARNRARVHAAADERVAYARWRAGLVVPAMITMALDLRGLYGPQVDRACLAAEPDVDQWEAGELYPSWEQLRALARLTGMAPSWFVRSDVEPLRVWETSMVFHLRAAERAYWQRQPAPVMRYPRAVLDERPPSPPDLPDADPVDLLDDDELRQLRERIAETYGAAASRQPQPAAAAPALPPAPASAATRARLRTGWRQLTTCAEDCPGCLLCLASP